MASPMPMVVQQLDMEVMDMEKDIQEMVVQCLKDIIHIGIEQTFPRRFLV